MTLPASEVDRTVARLNALGVPLASGELTARFACVLPGHNHDARLVHQGRWWKYSCKEVGRLLELGEVRAGKAYGFVPEISPIERARWLERLDYEALISERGPETRIPLPPNANDSTRRVGEAWRLFVGLRSPVFPPGEPYLFARHFASAYCHVTESEARYAIEALEDHGSMIRVGVHPRLRAIEWRPGPTYYVRYGDPAVADEEIVKILKETFGAVELRADPA